MSPQNPRSERSNSFRFHCSTRDSAMQHLPITFLYDTQFYTSYMANAYLGQIKHPFKEQRTGLELIGGKIERGLGSAESNLKISQGATSEHHTLHPSNFARCHTTTSHLAASCYRTLPLPPVAQCDVKRPLLVPKSRLMHHIAASSSVA